LDESRSSDDEFVTRDLNVIMNIGDELQRRLPARK